MTRIESLVNQYISTWNETDGARRRALIEATWTDDAGYVDPLMKGDGHAGIDNMIAAVQQRFPGMRFSLNRPVDAYGNCVRFSWDLAAGGEPPLVSGTDFAVLSTDDRLQSVTGFIDRMPAAA